jgi:anti-anti-sigma factor
VGDSFRIDLVQSDDASVVLLRGEIDLDAAPELSAALGEAVAAGRRIFVDLNGTTFIDSTGLSAIVAANTAVPKGSLVVVLGNAAQAVHRTLQVSGLDDVFTFGRYEDESQ